MKHKIKVGQTVYVLPVNYRCSRDVYNKSVKSQIQEVTVSKVGRVYFYLEKYCWLKFNLKTLQDMYPNTYQVYLSKEDLLKDVERQDLSLKILNDLSKLNQLKKMSLDQLKRIESIIEEENNKNK